MKTKKVYEVEEEVILQMLPSSKSKKPICRIDDGLICIIDFKAKGFFPYYSKWNCKIVSVAENKLIIEPLECVSSSSNEKFIIEEKLKQLKTEKVKKEKVVKKYQYLSKQEQL